MEYLLNIRKGKPEILSDQWVVILLKIVVAIPERVSYYWITLAMTLWG